MSDPKSDMDNLVEDGRKIVKAGIDRMREIAAALDSDQINPDVLKLLEAEMKKVSEQTAENVGDLVMKACVTELVIKPLTQALEKQYPGFSSGGPVTLPEEQ